jgi:hypothetical protein
MTVDDKGAFSNAELLRSIATLTKAIEKLEAAVVHTDNYERDQKLLDYRINENVRMTRAVQVKLDKQEENKTLSWRAVLAPLIVGIILLGANLYVTIALRSG